MAKGHSPEFLKIVDEAKRNIRECTIADVKAQLEANAPIVLIDVREDHEFSVDHLPGALHIGKGVIERDIEEKVPSKSASLVLYCGGGFRSALAADALQRMGYSNVISMDGGIRAWREAGYALMKPTTQA